MRYLVVDTGSWLPGKRVLIAPEYIGVCDPSQGVLSVHLTQEQIKNSPDIDTDKPVSRQQEMTLRQHYDWPAYWTMRDPIVAEVMTARPSGVSAIPPAATEVMEVDPGDPYLEDFIIDSETWHVRYIVVDTRNWLPGGKNVLIAPNWIKSVSWELSRVYVALSENEIKTSPQWHGTSETLSRDYEAELYNHYGRPTYWNS